MVGETKTKRQKKRVSMKLMATLAPAQAEIEAGVGATANQQNNLSLPSAIFTNQILLYL